MNLLDLLPTIHSYLVGMLMAWSFVAIIGIHKILAIVYKNRKCVRMFDVLALVFTYIGFLIITIPNFFFATQIATMLEIMLMADVWYTAFLVYVSQNCLSSLPVVKSIYKV